MFPFNAIITYTAYLQTLQAQGCIYNCYFLGFYIFSLSLQNKGSQLCTYSFCYLMLIVPTSGSQGHLFRGLQIASWSHFLKSTPAWLPPGPPTLLSQSRLYFYIFSAQQHKYSRGRHPHSCFLNQNVRRGKTVSAVYMPSLFFLSGHLTFCLGPLASIKENVLYGFHFTYIILVLLELEPVCNKILKLCAQHLPINISCKMGAWQ